MILYIRLKTIRDINHKKWKKREDEDDKEVEQELEIEQSSKTCTLCGKFVL